MLSRPPPAETPCVHWEENGKCPRGLSCAYQHRDRSHLLSLRDGLLEEIASFGRPERTDSGKQDFETHVAPLASYDWLEAEYATIAVPGMEPRLCILMQILTWTGNPPELVEPHFPVILQPDSIAFRGNADHGTFQRPYDYRLESLAQACLHTDPTSSFENIHFVGGLNNLRQILHFAFGQCDKSFRVDIERYKNTILMTRWEPNAAWLTQTSPCRGYGRGFEQAITRHQTEHAPTTSHHRVISHVLEDLHLVIQHQADACSCECGIVTPRTVFATSDGTLEQMDQIRAPVAEEDEALTIIDTGVVHSSDCMVEIKSRNIKNTSSDDRMAQMWLSGQTRLYLARHLRGFFSTDAVEYRSFGAEVEGWRRRNGDQICTFLKLLRAIRSTVCEPSATATVGKYALIYDPDQGKDHLTLLQRQTGQDFMREKTKRRLWKLS